jgi:hypothetical protein
VYAIYLPTGGVSRLDLQGNTGTFTVRWFDPKRGGDLVEGSILEVRGPGVVSLGRPSRGAGPDWVAVVRRK